MHLCLFSFEVYVKIACGFLEVYNFILSCVSCPFPERAFGKLKGRFKRLSNVRTKCPAKAKLLLTACCVLHNFCIRHNDFFDGDEVHPDDDENDDNNGQAAPGVTVDPTGHLKRQTLMRNMRR